MCNYRTYQRRYQRKRKKMFATTPIGTTVTGASKNYIFGNACGWVELAPSKDASVPVKKEPVNKEKKMCYDCDCADISEENIDIRKLDHAEERIRDIKREKEKELRIQFGIDNDKTPSSAKDLIDRITSGKYVLRDSKEVGYWDSFHPMNFFIWRDPKAVKDMEGFEKAQAELETAFDAFTDKVVLSDDATRLSTIESALAWKTSIVPAAPTA